MDANEYDAKYENSESAIYQRWISSLSRQDADPLSPGGGRPQVGPSEPQELHADSGWAVELAADSDHEITSPRVAELPSGPVYQRS